MSFRFRYLLLFYISVLTFLLTAAIIGLYTVRFQEHAIKDLTEYGQTITVNTSYSLADDLFEENYAPLQEFVQEFSSRLQVSAIEISDPQWNTLAASDIAKLGSHMDKDKVADCLPVGQENICARLNNDREQMVITAPIMIEDLELGQVRVYLPMQKMLAHAAVVQREGILIGFLCWLLAVALGFYVMDRLTKPVRKFVEATESISRGDFNVDLPKAKWVLELERFAQALRVMAGAIASREQELRQSETKFRHLFERAIEGIFVAGEGGLIMDANPAFIAMVGASQKEDLLGRNLFTDFFIEQSKVQEFHDQIATPGFVTSYELEMKTLLGASITASLSCHPVRNEEGTVVVYEGMIRNITARKGAEQEIIRMRNYLNNIIESMPSVLVTVDEEDVISQWNSAAAQLLSISTAQAVGKKIQDVTPFFDKYSHQLAEIHQGHEPLELHRERISHDGGREGIYNLTLFPLVANGSHGIAIRLDDITELDSKEQQLRQVQKMESVGTLAGGLAHDFNNILGGVLGNLSLMENRLKNDGEIPMVSLQGYLERMTSATDRAVDLVRQLMTLSRRQDIDLVPVDLNLSIKHVLKICDNTIDKSVKIISRPTATAANVLADPTQIEQVILNLCINAAHAMTEMRKEAQWGGILDLGLKQIMVTKNFQKAHPGAREGLCWRLTVSDNGVGVQSSLIDKIFDPFFTTKEKGKGTGLGLAMVYNIVTQLGGFIDLYSEVGIGSTFKVYLPVLNREVQAAETGTAVSIKPGKGVVLVIDDDDLLLDVSRDILQAIGYRVMTAKDGLEGVELYQQNKDLIVAVLLDMVMPVMSGKEAYLELKKINNEVKVLLSSGFCQDHRIDEIMQLGVNKFLPKPYNMESLGLAMQEVIDQ